MNDEPENYTTEAVNTGCSVLIWGVLLSLLVILALVCFSLAAEAQAPVKLQVEPFIPADTCALVYDMRGFKGKTLSQYIYHLEWQMAKNDDDFLFLFPPELISFYRIEFKPRKACLADLLDQAVSGTDLTWSCEGKNILIYRK